MTDLTNNLLEHQAKDFLRQALLAAAQIDANELESLIDFFELVSFKKNKIIIDEGVVADNFYFIFKGMVRIYYYKNDKQVIERFEKEGGMIGGNFTHITKKPGTHIYESVEDVILLKIKYTDIEQLCKKSHQIEHLYRKMIEIFHTNYVQRLSTFKSTSTEQRYHEFIKQNSDIANRVSLKDIANYLDMTSETISRIRAKPEKPNRKD